MRHSSAALQFRCMKRGRRLVVWSVVEVARTGSMHVKRSRSFGSTGFASAVVDFELTSLIVGDAVSF